MMSLGDNMESSGNRINTQATPIRPNERIDVVDIIRGFALLGILLVNMAFFSTPIIYIQAAGLEWWHDTWDKWTQVGIVFFAEGKFYPMFSFLFGFGFMIFIQRAEQKGLNPVRLYLRRILILLGIGLIHAFFIWAGDILVIYSLLAFILVLFRHSKPKTLLWWAFILLMIPMILMSLLFGLLFLGSVIQDETSLMAQHEAHLASLQEMIDQSLAAYGKGSFADIFSQRVTDLSYIYNSAFISAPIILAMFLFGVYAVKINIFREINKRASFIKKIWFGSMLIGIPLSLIQATGSQALNLTEISIYDFTYYIAYFIGGPALCFLYITSILLLMRKEQWIQRFSVIGSVGRMALSNYLFQSLVCTTIFYSYGLGLYGQVSPVFGLLLTLLIYFVQVIISHFWLKSYSYGPMEWIWRRLTYREEPVKMVNYIK
jgi:uncharacterized protein